MKGKASRKLRQQLRSRRLKDFLEGEAKELIRIKIYDCGLKSFKCKPQFLIGEVYKPILRHDLFLVDKNFS
jgi:hypothetical protein